MGCYKQRGLSLVELMVALLLSTLLMLGIMQVYVDNRFYNFFQTGQMENNMNSRFAVMMLDSEIHKAGYRKNPVEGYMKVFPADGSDFAAGDAVRAINENSFEIRYQPHSSKDVTCSGQSPSGSGVGYVDYAYYTYSANFTLHKVKFEFADSAIKCNGDEIISNVHAAEFLYAIPLSSSDPGAGVKYVKHDEIGSSAIYGVRYRLLLSSTVKKITDSSDSVALSAFYENGSDELGSDDKGGVYQVVSKNIQLRNLESWSR